MKTCDVKGDPVSGWLGAEMIVGWGAGLAASGGDVGPRVMD